MLYKSLTKLARIVLKIFFRAEVYGADNVPTESGMILAVNHKSYWDPVVAGAFCPRQLTFMAKSDLFKNKLFGMFITKLGAFPVKRGKGDVGAIKSAFKILKGDNAMLMFPEGRRVKNGERTKAKTGVSTIAIHSKVPVVPLCISGDYKLFGKIKVTFGEPIVFDEYYDGKLPETAVLQELATSVMDKIYSYDTLKIGDKK